MAKHNPVTIPHAPKGWFDYRYYLLSTGELAVLRTDRDINAAFRAWRNRAKWRVFPRKMPDLWKGKAFVSIINTEGEESAVSIPLVRYPELDRFADGRWLVASTRAVGEDANGVLLESDGRVSRSFPLGDGIEHVRCAPGGTIWVGYFDAGVFGNSIGSGGIVNFDQHGQTLWSFNDPGRGRQEFVDDCYALTLDGGDIWTCFYSAFPIARVRDGRETIWANAITGAKALAVEGDFILLAGGYGADANRIALMELRQGKVHLIGSYEWPEIEGAELVCGRSSAIHVVNNRTWTRVTVKDAQVRLGNI